MEQVLITQNFPLLERLGGLFEKLSKSTNPVEEGMESPIKLRIVESKQINTQGEAELKQGVAKFSVSDVLAGITAENEYSNAFDAGLQIMFPNGLQVQTVIVENSNITTIHYEPLGCADLSDIQVAGSNFLHTFKGLIQDILEYRDLILEGRIAHPNVVLVPKSVSPQMRRLIDNKGLVNSFGDNAVEVINLDKTFELAERAASYFH